MNVVEPKKKKNTISNRKPKTSKGKKAWSVKTVSEYASSDLESSDSEEDEENKSFESSEEDGDDASARETFRKERYYFVDETVTEDLGTAKIAYSYYTEQDTIGGFGFRKNEKGERVPRPLIDSYGAKRLAKGGNPFISPTVIGHLKDRAGVESIQAIASEKLAKLAEESVAAITAHAIINCKALGRRTISPSDVRNGSSDMGISHLRC